MKDVIPFYKKRGETPLAALKRLREERPELANEPLSYAGRLDPLADGLLLVLAGEANKERARYLSLSKVYRVRVLFGFSTDTYDIAGMVSETASKRVQRGGMAAALAEFEGTSHQPYPPYASKPVRGKPLFVWAREGRLSEIEIPSHTVCIDSARLLEMSIVTGAELGAYVSASLGLLAGDFRQEQIRASWREALRRRERDTYDLALLEVSCGSGAYMRVLAHELGARLGIPALALSITRMRIGAYTLEHYTTESSLDPCPRL